MHHEAICHSTDLADPKLRSLYVSGNIKYQFRKSFFALSFYNLINAQLDWNKHPKMFNSSLEEQFSRNQSIPDMHLMMAASIELKHNLPTNYYLMKSNNPSLKPVFILCVTELTFETECAIERTRAEVTAVEFEDELECR
ncbi:uncharacterized protein LOC129753883 [Uranotaenia lowii]|uniref:uncharacterized protein LOC129753883 n=1 Tax=Uranotaenia lowii TaxID=190385 RepID=UPI002478A0A3|nr:uncharacterized protein LOC129753883 [Uranotaenia lowii]